MHINIYLVHISICSTNTRSAWGESDLEDKRPVIHLYSCHLVIWTSGGGVGVGTLFKVCLVLGYIVPLCRLAFHYACDFDLDGECCWLAWWLPFGSCHSLLRRLSWLQLFWCLCGSVYERCGVGLEVSPKSLWYHSIPRV